MFYQQSSLTFMYVNMIVSALSSHYSVVIAIIFTGSNVTSEARATPKILSKFMSEQSESDKIDFMHFVAQIRTRNLDVENFLFKINWNAFMTVSLLLKFCYWHGYNFIIKVTSTVATYLIITCQMAAPNW